MDGALRQAVLGGGVQCIDVSAVGKLLVWGGVWRWGLLRGLAIDVSERKRSWSYIWFIGWKGTELKAMQASN